MQAKDDFQARIVQAISAARQAGALVELPTASTVVVDQQIAFVVHVARQASDKPRTIDQPRPTANPFLPYDPVMLVLEVPPYHVCLLNKYYVVPGHVLVVTRQFEPQEAPLSVDDFRAWWFCLSRFASLGFYNSGRTAGASQPHKHMQLIPWPAFRTHVGKPLTAVYQEYVRRGETSSVARLPFRHALYGWTNQPSEADTDWPVELHRIYQQLLASVGIAAYTAPDGTNRLPPYNLLLTREWMVVIPRRQDPVEGISMNAMAYAGSFVAMGDEQLETIRGRGPLYLLAEAGFPAK